MSDTLNLGGYPEPGSSPPYHGGGAANAAYLHELRTYLLGLGLAVILTAVPFALVYWRMATTASLWIIIGCLATVQAVVHFRCFLHLSLARENADKILLILFTAVLLILMVGGTVWVLGDLHSRMMQML